MKKKIILLSIPLLLLFSCHRDGESGGALEEQATTQSLLMSSVQYVDSLYLSDGTMAVDTMTEFIQKALQYTERYPEDELAPEILMKAGNYAMRIAQASEDKAVRARFAEQALDIFNLIIKVYPDHPSVKYCYWSKGIIYEEILQMYSSAENEYRDFLHLFPNDSLAPVIQFSIDHLGQSMDLIMEEVEHESQRANP